MSSLIIDDKIRVGDLVQYHYADGALDRVLTTRKVIAVAHDAVVVEGGYRLPSHEITAHIPLHDEEGAE